MLGRESWWRKILIILELLAKLWFFILFQALTIFIVCDEEYNCNVDDTWAAKDRSVVAPLRREPEGHPVSAEPATARDSEVDFHLPPFERAAEAKMAQFDFKGTNEFKCIILALLRQLCRKKTHRNCHIRPICISDEKLEQTNESKVESISRTVKYIFKCSISLQLT